MPMADTRTNPRTFTRSAIRLAARVRSHILCAAAVLMLAGALAGCAATIRLPAVPLVKAAEAHPLGIPNARFYMNGDKHKVEELAREVIAIKKRLALQAGGRPAESNYLAISGGGDDGAFGAGLLLGWSARGDRPSFDIVTGISTGALTAPFAYLGPAYDPQLKAVFTNTTKQDVLVARPILYAALASDALADSTPLRNLIASYVDHTMIRRIAEEYDKGRLLLIATTNLDQSQSVVWNIGAIAKSGGERARALIIDVLRASASIPGAFPPVMLDVTVDGQRYQEMHVDGGAVAQAFLYPPSFSLRAIDKKLNRKVTRHAYVIRNGRLSPPEETVKQQTLSIVGQTVATMIANSGVNDTYRIYLETKRDGVEFNLAYIGDDFTTPYSGPFYPAYMRRLFDYGYSKARAGHTWLKKPPEYSE